MTTEVLYPPYDNVNCLVLTENKEPVSLGSVTSVIIRITGVDYDSDILGGTKIWWNEQVASPFDKTVLVDALKFKLGQDVGLAKGKYEDCWVILFDVSNPNGVVWTSTMTTQVK